MVDGHTDRQTDICFYRVAMLLKIMTFSLYEYTFLFYFINQTLSLKLKAHFKAISFQKAVVRHFLLGLVIFLMVFKIFYSKQTNHKNKQISKLLF